MPPIVCNHCGMNFMRHNLDPEAPKLCNNCMIREERRNPKKEGDKMDTVDILIKCPKEVQRDIEEYCLQENLSFTQYFLSLHETFFYTQEQKQFDVKDHYVDPENPGKPDFITSKKEQDSIESQTKKKGNKK